MEIMENEYKVIKRWQQRRADTHFRICFVTAKTAAPPEKLSRVADRGSNANEKNNDIGIAAIRVCRGECARRTRAPTEMR